jgi:prefoldin alpha subunit
MVREWDSWEREIKESVEPRLEHALADAHTLRQHRSKLAELRNALVALRRTRHDENDVFQAQLQLGARFYLDATVPDTSRLYVDVGLGYHAEMSVAEALDFCDDRDASLAAREAALGAEAAALKARARLLVGAIDHLISKESVRPELAAAVAAGGRGVAALS